MLRQLKFEFSNCYEISIGYEEDNNNIQFLYIEKQECKNSEDSKSDQKQTTRHTVKGLSRFMRFFY